MYRYVEDDVRLETLRVREEKRVLALGEGGEGYIASDEWCYNCGGSGHLGDVSPYFTHSPVISSCILTVHDPGLRRAAASGGLAQRALGVQPVQHPLRSILIGGNGFRCALG